MSDRKIDKITNKCIGKKCLFGFMPIGALGGGVRPLAIHARRLKSGRRRHDPKSSVLIKAATMNAGKDDIISLKGDN